MKEYLKNPNFYYAIIPLSAALWVVFAWGVSLPAAGNSWDRKQKQYKDSQGWITQILELAPQRLEYQTQKGASRQFDYATAVEQFAKICKIPPSDYSLQAGRETKRGGRKTKSANVKIEPVDVERFAQFLSNMLFQWPDLQCEQLKLTKQKGGPDVWKADIKFTYYY
ncbi:MAG TPA: hypothetical protein HPP87_02080 [Planctomycetes bacterium]|nr:hypothetical protein [Planctomycetota bacterium]HIJ70135.1 hypothetical protein [Planctomycetota bacterium]